MFLGNTEKVYILDKAEGNAAQINDHSAWGAVWSAVCRSLSLLVTDSPPGTLIPIKPSLWRFTQTPSVHRECIFPMAHTLRLVGMVPLVRVETLAP